MQTANTSEQRVVMQLGPSADNVVDEKFDEQAAKQAVERLTYHHPQHAEGHHGQQRRRKDRARAAARMSKASRKRNR